MKTRFLTAVSVATILSAGAALALPPAPSAPPMLMAIEPVDGEARVAPVSEGYRAFADEEARLRTALDAAPTPIDRNARARALAVFYASHGLCLEALGVLRVSEEALETPQAIRFAAQCEITVGRHEAALARLSPGETGEAAVLRAVALTGVGAYREAAEIFRSVGARERCRRECAQAAAAAFLAESDFDAANAALAETDPISEESAFLRALIAFRKSGGRQTRTRLEKIMQSGAAFGSHAELALLEADVEAGAVDGDAARTQLAQLMMQRRGGEFERDALMLQGVLASDADYETAFSSLRRVVDQYGRSDAARQAVNALEVRLIALADDRRIAPEDAARMFYENVEFAPPGEAGDALIRSLAERLRALDLLAEAAELLEHQTFNRLRGSARSTLAADLAQLYLSLSEPDDALRVIRSTRYAGLVDEVAVRRRIIEAEALELLGRTDAALVLLDGAESSEALRLKGEIAWRREDWGAAAAAYASLFDAAGGDDTAVRAAAAFILAGDRRSYDAFVNAGVTRVESASARTLIQSLSMENTSADEFRSAYDAVFSAGAKS